MCSMRALEKVKEKFPNLDFSKFKYEHSTKDSIVICPLHGEFLISQKKLLKFVNFNGCPNCKERNENLFTKSGWRKVCGTRKSYLYILSMMHEGETWIKIGISINPKSRIKQYSASNIKYNQLDIVEFSNPDDTYNMEKILFKLLKKYRYYPKIKFAGSTECFINCSEVLYIFNLLNKRK